MFSVNQNDRAALLLEELKKDSVQYKDLEVADHMADRKTAIRSLMNIRMPRELPKKLLRLQDDYLQGELRNKGIVRLSDIPTVEEQYGVRRDFADKISVWQGDITRLEVGAIVNAANSGLLGCFIPCHRCIDNAIHSAAGMQLRAECSRIMNEKRSRYGGGYEEPAGLAVLTGAYNLPCEYVIHTVGPIVRDGLTGSHRQKLRGCYESGLQCCAQNGIRSVAFCCISTGEFHFPNEEAARIAVDTVTDFLKTRRGDCPERIIFNVFKDDDRAIYEKILG